MSGSDRKGEAQSVFDPITGAASTQLPSLAKSLHLPTPEALQEVHNCIIAPVAMLKSIIQLHNSSGEMRIPLNTEAINRMLSQIINELIRFTGYDPKLDPEVPGGTFENTTGKYPDITKDRAELYRVLFEELVKEMTTYINLHQKVPQATPLLGLSVFHKAKAQDKVENPFIVSIQRIELFISQIDSICKYTPPNPEKQQSFR